MKTHYFLLPGRVPVTATDKTTTTNSSSSSNVATTIKVFSRDDTTSRFSLLPLPISTGNSKSNNNTSSTSSISNINNNSDISSSSTKDGIGKSLLGSINNFLGGNQ